MPNLYGVSNPLALPVAYGPIGGTNVPCPAGSETNVITSGPIAAISPGFYYPMLWLSLSILYGGTLPTQIIVAFRIGAGSDVDSVFIPTNSLVASTANVFSATLIGASSQVAWQGSGSTINVTLSPSAQAITLQLTGSRAAIALFRAPDQ